MTAFSANPCSQDNTVIRKRNHNVTICWFRSTSGAKRWEAHSGKIAKATSKGLTLNDVQFGDGGKSQAFKVRASRLKDLKVLTVASQSGKRKQQRQQQQQNDYNQNRGEHIDWQDDDVSKIKQQEDFDFQRNLGMFNKKTSSHN